MAPNPIHVYHTDGLGLARALSDRNGNLVQRYDADEFGVPTSTTGNSAQPFLNTGEQRLARTQA